MKKILAISLLAILPMVLAPFGAVSVETQSFSWLDKIIALDAGHGGTDLGATYPPNSGEKGDVYEKDVNLAVIYTLKQKLEAAGAKVVLTRECDEGIASRKDRVDLAIEKCKTKYGRKCDVLVSVHHNGNVNTTYNGTMVIYNEKQDIPLAKSLLEALVPLTNNNEGLDHGGYGMTVYGHLVSAITEAYYITNAQEAQWYLDGALMTVSQYDSSSSCNYQVRFGDRIEEETQALYDGLFNYFNSSGGGNGGGGDEGGGKPEKCTPWPECKRQ